MNEIMLMGVAVAGILWIMLWIVIYVVLGIIIVTVCYYYDNELGRGNIDLGMLIVIWPFLLLILLLSWIGNIPIWLCKMRNR